MKQRVILKGKEGLDLLHRISTIDLKHLKLQQKSLGLILNPQGKIRSAFNILMNQVDEAEIEFEDNFLEILDQFTFSEKYEVTKLSASTLPEMPELDRILNLIPKFGAEYTSHEDTNPLEVNLRTAVSDQKGCYPGQEVIEKIISLGSPSKKLCLLEGVLENISLPTKLLGQNGTEAGILTSYDQGFALAIVKRNFLKDSEKFLVGSQTLTLRKISET